MSNALSSDLDFLIDDVMEAAGQPATAAPWRVLIVDDDESVHSISRVVLGDVHFQGRGVEILSAYSGRQAAALLRQTSDVAVILLDVVMEDDDAGLRLVREIRDEMRNTQLRIILRTGQPGQAPEREVIVNYDINDYKSKTELTAQKLFTATIAALRSYSDIVALERGRRGLERIIAGAPELFARHSLSSFAETLLRQVIDLSGQTGEGVVVTRADEAGQDSEAPFIIVAGSGAFTAPRGRPYRAALPDPVGSRIDRALQTREPATAEGEFVRPIRTPDGRRAVVYVRAAAAFDADHLALIDTLCAMVGVGLGNVHLHERLLRHQAGLEAQVAARTRELAAVNADLMLAQSQINEELRVARTLQQSILPTAFPPHDGCKGHAVMRAVRMIGGDFYDMFQLDPHRLGVVVADVSGKGVPAALFMVLARTILQDVALRQVSPAACLAEANRLLIGRNPLSLFVTVLYGIMDARTGEFTFCSGGHAMPYVLRTDGTVEVAPGKPAPLLGLIDEAAYSDHRVALAPGDGLLLFTDGVTECLNAAGECYGEARLRAWIAASGAAAPDAMLAALIAEVDRFSGGCPASDDVTALMMRYHGQMECGRPGSLPAPF